MGFINEGGSCTHCCKSQISHLDSPWAPQSEARRGNGICQWLGRILGSRHLEADVSPGPASRLVIGAGVETGTMREHEPPNVHLTFRNVHRCSERSRYY